jgi:hypothetical protein
MTANVFGNRFYGHRDPAWHSLGFVTQEGITATEAYRRMGGSYYFELRPTYTTLNGIESVIGLSIVRSPVPDDATERCFGIATEDYKILQPERICEIFDESVNQPVETMGMLGKGERTFLTWKIPSIDIKGDEIMVYGFVAAGHDAKYGYSLNVVTTRVVCQNTWAIAIKEAENNNIEGRGRIWSGRHNSPNLERDLSIWMAHVQKQAEANVEVTKSLFTRFAETKLSNMEDTFDILNDIYAPPAPVSAYFPEQLIGEEQEKIDDKINKNRNDIEAVWDLFTGAGTAIDETCYGLFNAVTEYENWGRATRKDPANSIMFGDRAKVMTKAAKVINEFVVANQ